MKSPEGGENGGRKMTSVLRKVDIRPHYLGECKIQRDSILKIGMKFIVKYEIGGILLIEVSLVTTYTVPLKKGI